MMKINHHIIILNKQLAQGKKCFRKLAFGKVNKARLQNKYMIYLTKHKNTRTDLGTDGLRQEIVYKDASLHTKAIQNN